MITKSFGVLILILALINMLFGPTIYGPGFRYRAKMGSIANDLKKGDLEGAMEAVKGGIEESKGIMNSDKIQLLLTSLTSISLIISAFIIVKQSNKIDSVNDAPPNA